MFGASSPRSGIAPMAPRRGRGGAFGATAPMGAARTSRTVPRIGGGRRGPSERSITKHQFHKALRDDTSVSQSDFSASLEPVMGYGVTRYNCKRHPLASKWFSNMSPQMFQQNGVCKRHPLASKWFPKNASSIFAICRTWLLKRVFENASLKWFVKCVAKMFVSLYSVHFLFYNFHTLSGGNDANVGPTQIFIYRDIAPS